MTRDETIALFFRGREAWNAWAECRLTERKALEHSGQWAQEINAFGAWGPTNEETGAWMEAARADFSFCRFSLAGSVNSAEEEATESIKSISVGTTDIGFSGFIFPSDARFGNTSFGGGVTFENATFRGNVYFGSAKFKNFADFNNCTFCCFAGFLTAIFCGRTAFKDSTFSSTAHFEGTSFQSSTTFVNAKFLGDVSFAGAKVNGTFNMTGACFNVVPAFNQADFRQAPDLDDVRFPLPGFWRGGKEEFDFKLPRPPGLGHGANLVTKYRAIRRIAIQGADYEREQMAFKGEIRAKRGIVHKFYHAGFWLGIVYDLLSDFGRSMWCPVLAWVACIIVFAVYFLGQNPDMIERRRNLPHEGFLRQIAAYSETTLSEVSKGPALTCVSKTLPKGNLDDLQNGLSGLAEPILMQTNPINEALSIAYHNAVIVLDSNGDSAHRAFGCLYGVERYGGNPVAYVPRSVAIASAIQRFLSAIFIFLFILAVRNTLRVK